ncbi:type II secretion system protein [Lentisphaera araneosa]|nr:type II secretion system protein [Lentisphaera araneosa]
MPKHGNKVKKIRGAFTLIEVLVAIAIIGILASMLLPVLSKARKTARRVLCINNLKQCATVIHIYAEDNDYSAAKTWSSASPDRFNHVNPGYDLRTQLGSYLNDNFETWMCPSVSTSTPINDPANTSEWRFNYLYLPGSQQVGDTARKLNENDGGDLLMTDSAYTWNSDWRTNHSLGGRLWTPFSFNPSLAMFADGYAEGVHGVYMDGHARWSSKLRATPTYSYNSTYYLPVD